MAAKKRATQRAATSWYKDAVIYELHVRAFFDGNDDGKGDFVGLTQKLDYLQDLGVTAVWLLPFYPSPLRDDGYDISDFFGVHSDYGTLADFKRFLREAKQRGIKVITELVLNHTSDQHELFQKARRAPAGSPARDFYVWSDDPQKYRDARVIFKDFEASNWTWDPAAKAYYWHRFYSHQPDLNFDSPMVREYIAKVMDFWLEMGVDGLRLDAVPYLFEREGTNCENLPETHDFLKELRRRVDAKFQDRMLLAEANQWPEEAAAYFGEGDECHMAFHFPIMPRLFMALKMEDCSPIVDILQQTPDVSDRGQWAIFLRNHDELTLEMVTDEERDYMYRFYAKDSRARINLGIRRRLAPLLGNHRRKMELLKGLLFSLPGTPVIYYGDEIGMGDNIYLGDRNGVRTPMQWNADRNAGFSRANAQTLYLPVGIDPEYHFEAVNISVQQNNPHSLFWWMKRLIDLRKRYKAFGRGSMEFIPCENRKILSFVRTYEEERILVVANLSRFVELAELDLSNYKDLSLVEMFGRYEFPPVKDERYRLTLGPNSFYWFRIRKPTVHEVDAASVPENTPEIPCAGSWAGLFSDSSASGLSEALRAYLHSRQWFEGKSHQLRTVGILEEFVLPYGDKSDARICLVQADFLDAPSESYLLPVAFASGQRAEKFRKKHPFSIIAEVRCADGKKSGEGVLFDAVADSAFRDALLCGIREGRRIRGRSGEIRMTAAAFLTAELDDHPESSLAKNAQRNTSILFGDRLILKLLRRSHPGVNPDAEIGRYLADRGFSSVPTLAGEISYHPRRGEVSTLAVLHCYVPNRGNAWQYTLDSLRRYFDDLLAGTNSPEGHPLDVAHLLSLSEQEPAPLAVEHIGDYLETAKLLGVRTAELHLALSSEGLDGNFASEDFSELYQRSMYQTLRGRANEALYLLRKKMPDIPEAHRPLAEFVLAGAGEIQKRLHALIGKKFSGQRIRCHGDYHLKQILYTGSDFQISDFEGSSAQSLQERRVKRSPLRDVAGMLRSFDYAANTILLGRVGVTRAEDVARLEPWARFWSQSVSAAFLRAYLSKAATGSSLPKTGSELETLLGIFLMDRALDELRAELETQPQWAVIPLKAIIRLLDSRA